MGRGSREGGVGPVGAGGSVVFDWWLRSAAGGSVVFDWWLRSAAGGSVVFDW